MQGTDRSGASVRRGRTATDAAAAAAAAARHHRVCRCHRRRRRRCNATFDHNTRHTLSRHDGLPSHKRSGALVRRVASRRGPDDSGPGFFVRARSLSSRSNRYIYMCKFDVSRRRGSRRPGDTDAERIAPRSVSARHVIVFVVLSAPFIRRESPREKEFRLHSRGREKIRKRKEKRLRLGWIGEPSGEQRETPSESISVGFAPSTSIPHCTRSQKKNLQENSEECQSRGES